MPAEWKNKLKSSCIKFGFTLHLTKAMLEYLCATSEGVMWDRHYEPWIRVPDNWIATETALTNRGLIERKTRAEIYGDPTWCVCRLTEAGKLVVELVKMAGLFRESVAAQVERMKRDMKDARKRA